MPAFSVFLPVCECMLVIGFTDLLVKTSDAVCFLKKSYLILMPSWVTFFGILSIFLGLS